MAVERMAQAGARPITTWAYVSELQRDWARAATAGQVTKLFAQRGGAFGQGLLWEWDLRNLKDGADAGPLEIDGGPFGEADSSDCEVSGLLVYSVATDTC